MDELLGMLRGEVSLAIDVTTDKYLQLHKTSIEGGVKSERVKDLIVLVREFREKFAGMVDDDGG